MKRMFFLSLGITLIIVSCTQEKKSPLEGTWNMVYGNWTAIDETYPADIGGGQIKMFSKSYFSHVGQFKLDTILDNHGCGSYTLDGNKFEEKIIYRYNGTDQGKFKKLLLDISNDTLILRWPVDENWELAEKFNIEKYVRLD
jgi:hypothetical protein